MTSHDCQQSFFVFAMFTSIKKIAICKFLFSKRSLNEHFFVSSCAQIMNIKKSA